MKHKSGEGKVGKNSEAGSLKRSHTGSNGKFS